MRWRGQGALGTEAICWCIDLRMRLDVLTIQLLQRTPLESLCVCVIFYALLLCVKYSLNLLIWNSSRKQSSCIMPLLCAVVCMYMMFVFLMPSSKDGTCWHILQAINSPVCMEIPHSAPPPHWL